jgi:hypothetical protein
MRLNHLEELIGKLERLILPLTSGRFAVKSGGMEYKKPSFYLDRYRPGASAPVGDFFITIESPCGSIFLPVGGES